MPKPPTRVTLAWEHDLVFTGHAGDRRVVTDGDSNLGLSPVQLLAVATAGCMAVDVVHILEKGRQAVKGLEVAFTGERSQDEPHRLTRVSMSFTVRGAVGQAQLDRAIELSREKYCSVWNSLREDIELEITTRIDTET